MTYRYWIVHLTRQQDWEISSFVYDTAPNKGGLELSTSNAHVLSFAWVKGSKPAVRLKPTQLVNKRENGMLALFFLSALDPSWHTTRETISALVLSSGRSYVLPLTDGVVAAVIDWGLYGRITRKRSLCALVVASCTQTAVELAQSIFNIAPAPFDTRSRHIT